MSAMQIFALNAARAGRSHLEQLAGILVNDATAPAAMRQQVAAALTEVNDVIETIEKALEPPLELHITVEGSLKEPTVVASEIRAALPRLPRRVPGATLS